MTEKEGAGQNRTEQNRTEKDRAGQNRREKDGAGQSITRLCSRFVEKRGSSECLACPDC